MALNEKCAQATLRLDGTTLVFQGDWIGPCLGRVEKIVSRPPWQAVSVNLDLSRLRSLDTAGARMIHRIRHRQMADGHTASIVNASERSRALLALVDREAIPVRPRPRPGLLEDTGRYVLRLVRESTDFMAFVGELGITMGRALTRPSRVRWAVLGHNLEAAGFRALPIVGLLSFLLGLVIAYQGGVQLAKYGANLYITDLVGISMVRELSPLMTAIIIAGRTGSAFTAQIGTMKVTEEIDALRTMGVRPMEQLVLPKVAALVIALPLLTVFSDLMGLLGGVVIADAVLGVTPISFVERTAEAVSVTSYVIGLGKAPVFAAIVGAVGCFQGFQVADSAESVGKHTTASVVQSIFLVIVVDAVFSVVFSRLGL